MRSKVDCEEHLSYALVLVAHVPYQPIVDMLAQVLASYRRCRRSMGLPLAVDLADSPFVARIGGLVSGRRRSRLIRWRPLFA